MITIGADLMGPELVKSRIDQAIMRTGQTVEAARGDWKEGTSPGVNVVFYVPGSIGTFSIPKIEASRFSRRQKMLLVAVPVPASIVQSEDAAEFVVNALYKANEIAEDVFARKGIGQFSREAADLIVEKVRNELRSE